MSGRQRGKVIKWSDDRGYGFIQPKVGGPEVFFHATGVKSKRRRPKIDDEVVFEISSIDSQKIRAIQVQFANDVITPSKAAALSAGIFLLGMAVMAVLGKVPLWVPSVYVFASMVSFAVFGVDKAKAQASQWRVSEATLHLIELLGGWPGALTAQYYFRHKNAKTSYQIVFWAIVACHLLFVFVWFWTIVRSNGGLGK